MRIVDSCNLIVVMLAVMILAFSCQRVETDDDSTPDDGGDDDTTGDDDEREIPPPTFMDEESLIVAVGDVHGDLAATREVLTVIGAIDGEDHWIGGEMVLVQTGDQIDRGDEDRAVLDLFEQLADEAHTAGGAVIAMLGNHETENVDLNLEWVTLASFAAFDDIEYDPNDEELLEFEEHQRGRAAAMRPGGLYAQMLAGRNMVQVIGPVAFVHGSLRTAHMDIGLEPINDQTHAWMRGETGRPMWLWGNFTPVWSRKYCDEPDEDDCATLQEVLDSVPAEVMVLGHTIQDGGIVSYCDGLAWCIDTGMSDYYGGTMSALEIVDGHQFNVIE